LPPSLSAPWPPRRPSESPSHQAVSLSPHQLRRFRRRLTNAQQASGKEANGTSARCPEQLHESIWDSWKIRASTGCQEQLHTSTWTNGSSTFSVQGFKIKRAKVDTDFHALQKLSSIGLHLGTCSSLLSPKIQNRLCGSHHRQMCRNRLSLRWYALSRK
jgi:hypothetical protein